MATDQRSAYPLSWPEAMPRRQGGALASQFKTTLPAALENVHAEIRRFGKDSGKPVTDVLISSNYALGDPNPKEAGVAVYFTWAGVATCVAVDRYGSIAHNLQAIYHVLEAERTKLRHGGLNIVLAAFRGYAALPPPPSRAPAKAWHEVLEVPPSATLLEAEQSYKKLRSSTHPDRGGDAGKFEQVQKAIEAARAALR